MLISKKFIVAIAAAGATALLFASFAGAETASNPPSSPAPRMTVEIGPAGRALLRGTLVSVGSGSLVVKSWGGNWTVNVADGAEVLPKVTGNVSDISSFVVGDTIGVNGTAASDAAWTINAKIVRNWTIKKTEKTNKKEAQKTEKSGRQAGTGKTFEGTASNIASDSLSLAVGSQTYTIKVSSTTNVVNKKFLKISLNSIKDGDKVRVFGSASDNEITAQVVRDISLPAQPAPKSNQ